MTEFLKVLLGPDFRTRVSGLMQAVGLIGALTPGVPEKLKWVFGILAGVGAIGLGDNAKDRQNHSTFAQVEEATKEEETKKKDPIGTER